MKKLFILCMTALAVYGVHAQDRTVRIDLQEAIDIALDDNPTIKIADLEIRKQEYVRKETLGSLYPQIDVTGSYSNAIVKSEIIKGVSFESDHTVTASASLTLPLFAPAIYKTLKLNDEQMRAAVEDARANKITLVNEVKKAFYGVLLAEESLRVLYASEANTSRTVEDTRVKFENGLAAEYDLITAEVQLSNLRPTIIQTENSIEVAKKMLKMYLNLPLDLNLQLDGDLDEFSELIDRFGTPIDYDLSENTDLTSMDIQIDILRRQLDVARTQRMPTVAAFSNFSYSGRDMDGGLFDMTGGGTGSTGGSNGKSFYWTHPLSAGVQVNIPIFAGNSRVNRERQIKTSIYQMELQREYLEQSVNVQLDNAVNDLITAREMMMANRKTVTQAQKGYDISNTRYEAGMGTILELNTAELALTQSRLNYTQSIYDYLAAQADYEKIKGEEN